MKAPFSWPNSSLSMRFSGIDPQSSTTKGSLRRGDSSWSALATSSFPVPVSPVTTTETSMGATFLRSEKISRMRGERPTIPAKKPASPAGACAGVMFRT